MVRGRSGAYIVQMKPDPHQEGEGTDEEERDQVFLPHDVLGEKGKVGASSYHRSRRSR